MKLEERGWGIICGCPICGEIRELLRTGERKILVKAWEKKASKKN